MHMRADLICTCAPAISNHRYSVHKNKSLTLPTTLLPGLENTSSSTSHYRMPTETGDEARPRTGEAVVLGVSDFVQIVDNGCLAPGRPMFGLNTNAFRPVTAQHIAREIVDRNGLSTSTTAVALTPPRKGWGTPEGWLDAVENALKKTKDGEVRHPDHGDTCLDNASAIQSGRNPAAASGEKIVRVVLSVLCGLGNNSRLVDRNAGSPHDYPMFI